MVYATYDYYADSYCGEVIPVAAFPKMIKKASQYIDSFTFGRITEENAGKYPSLPDCACDMAEAIYKTIGRSGKEDKEKKSETTDGYSVTYVTERADGSPVEEMLRRKLYSIAKTYLLNTGLLYCGVDVC